MLKRENTFQPAKVAEGNVSESDHKIKHFCLIQLQLLVDREKELRKQILDCKIQKEFLTSILSDIEELND